MQKIRWSMVVGLGAVVLYVTHVVLGGVLWSGYNHAVQPISDLTATGAPNRSLLLILTQAYGILALLFPFFLWREQRGQSNSWMLAGFLLLFALHLVSFSYGFFPQDLPGAAPTFAGAMHLVVTALIVPFTIGAPLVLGWGMRKVPALRTVGTASLACGGAIFVLGGLTGLAFATAFPWFGLVERLNIGTLMLWMVLVALGFGRLPRQNLTEVTRG